MAMAAPPTASPARWRERPAAQPQVTLPATVQAVSIWIEAPHPRARYAAEQLFRMLLGWPVRWAERAEDLRPAEGPCLAYAREAPSGAFHLMPMGALGQLGDARSLVPARFEGVPVLFPVEGGHLMFDAFAAAFVMLARVEEWAGLPLDAHGRPQTQELLAARHGFLHRPVVDEWALLLAARWHALDPRVPAPQRQYHQVATIDLDNGFKYLGREAWRSAGAGLRDALRGRWAEVGERVRVLRGAAPDPFALDEEAISAIRSSAQRRIAFILAADRGPMDHAVPVEHPRYARYLSALRRDFEIGLHPSYRTSDETGRMGREQGRLAAAIGGPVHLTRQHFLRTALPGSFREAIALGMREEHSMGCHDALGFRAGTCTPHHWYDLEREQATALLIHPFAVMDNTLREKLRLSPEQAVQDTSAVIAAARRVHGAFTGLWHESFLAATGDALPWRKAILRIIATARP